MKQLSTRTITGLKLLLFLACLIPLIRLVAAGVTGSFGPDPVADMTQTTGTWALNLLLATLGFTPLRKLTGWHWLIRLRRTVALYAFFYACLHFMTYLVFDQFFDWHAMGKDIAKRPFITAGFAAFVAMVPLAITSTDAMIKRLGGRSWKAMHRLTYLIGAGAVFHYFWLVKRDVTLPSVYALVLIVLLCARLVERPKKPSACFRPDDAGGLDPTSLNRTGLNRP